MPADSGVNERLQANILKLHAAPDMTNAVDGEVWYDNATDKMKGQVDGETVDTALPHAPVIGSVIYSDGTSWSVLVPGSDGEVLKLASGVPSWETDAGGAGGDLLAANNLSDLANAGTARTNLGLGTLATQSGTFSGTSSGTNTGDQTSIVGITGTTAEFNTALSDGSFATGGGTATGTNTGDQTSIVGITGTIAQFNTAVTDADLATQADLSALNASNLTSGTVPLARLVNITDTEVSASAAIAFTKLATTSAASKLLGAGSAGASTPAEITLGTNLSMSGTTLNAASSSGGVGSSVVKYKTVGEGVASSTTLQNDDDFYFSIAAGEVWLFCLDLKVVANASGGFKCDFTVPSGASGSFVPHGSGAFDLGGSATAIGTPIGETTSATQTQMVFSITGRVTSPTNAGTVQFQWAQNASNASQTSLNSGSYMIATRLS